MILSRISCFLLATHAVTFPSVFAQGLRKSKTISESKTQISNYETIKSSAQKGLSFLSSFIGDNQGNNERSLSSAVHYNQLGDDIDGTVSEKGHLGKAVAISKDGLRVAICSPEESVGKGVTRVFDWDATLDKWVQVGPDIVGPSNNFNVGFSIDMNEDGTRLILGAPAARNGGRAYVYELDPTNTWQMLGNTLIQAGTQQAGFSVTMNASGDQIALGAPNTAHGTGLGRVIAYKLVNGQWDQMGQNLDCDDYYGSYFGNSISMDASGDRLVIGGREDSYYSFGTVKVYDYDNTTSQWVQIGNIDGEYYYDRFGSDVDISEDGSTIAVAAYTSYYTPGLSLAGYFKVFEYNANTANWETKGVTVVGTDVAGFFGDTISISGDGTHVAVGVPGNDEAGVNAGKVVVFAYSEAEQAWVEEDSVTGECAKHKLGEHGEATALDRTGSHLVVGSQRGGTSYYSGMARVYESLAGPGTSGSENVCD